MPTCWTPTVESPIWSPSKSSCCESGDRARACCCWNCCHLSPASLQSVNADNWIVWKERFKASPQTSSPFTSSATTPHSTTQTSPTKRAHQPTVQTRSCPFQLPSAPVAEQRPAIEDLLHRRQPESMAREFLSLQAQTFYRDDIQDIPE